MRQIGLNKLTIVFRSPSAILCWLMQVSVSARTVRLLSSSTVTCICIYERILAHQHNHIIAHVYMHSALLCLIYAGSPIGLSGKGFRQIPFFIVLESLAIRIKIDETQYTCTESMVSPKNKFILVLQPYPDHVVWYRRNKEHDT